jgi:hypothetical protein
MKSPRRKTRAITASRETVAQWLALYAPELATFEHPRTLVKGVFYRGQDALETFRPMGRYWGVVYRVLLREFNGKGVDIPRYESVQHQQIRHILNILVDMGEIQSADLPEIFEEVKRRIV